MSDITLSKAVRSNLLSLQNTASMMAKTQERLATGNKVNSALDNPTNFFTASALNSRAGDINQLLDGMANGIQTIKAADNGLTAITKTLESMQSTLRQARQDKSFQTQSFNMAMPAAASLTGEETLTFTGGTVGTGSIALTTTAAVGGTPTTPTTPTTPSAATATGSVGFAAAANSVAGTGVDANAFDWQTLSGEEVTITVGGETATFSFAADEADAPAGSVWIDPAGASDDIRDAFLDAAEDAFGAGVITINASDELEIAANADIGVTAGAFAEELLGAADATTAIDEAATFAISPALADSLTLTIGEEEFTIDVDGLASLEAVRDAINAHAGFSDAGTASITFNDAGEGVLTITAATAGEAITFGDDAESEAITDALGLASVPASGGGTGGGTGGGEAPGALRAKTVNELVKDINDTFSGQVRASNDNGKLRIENLATSDLTIGGVNATSGRIDGSTGESTTKKIDGNAVRTDLANQFRELRDQLDKLADDASFNGINLLRGDNLQITFNETSTSELNIRSKDEQGISSTVLGVATDLQASDLDSDANIDDLIADVKTAINTVRSQSSAFGSSLSIVQNRQDFSKNMINTLQTGASNLTLADMNEEAANLLALQTRQSLSSSALSMASQADQSVLQLLR